MLTALPSGRVVSKNMLYYYFKSKEGGYFVAALDRTSRRAVARAAERYQCPGERSGHGDLQQLVHHTFHA